MNEGSRGQREAALPGARPTSHAGWPFVASSRTGRWYASTQDTAERRTMQGGALGR